MKALNGMQSLSHLLNYPPKVQINNLIFGGVFVQI
jgi:hypothetical protein